MIKIYTEVNVSNKRFNYIYKIAEFVMNDLQLTDITINILSSKEMMTSYYADGLCYSKDEIDIVNKRDKKLLFKVIAHELRHAWQHFHNFWKNNTVLRENDSVKYENIIYNKFLKNKEKLYGNSILDIT